MSLSHLMKSFAEVLLVLPEILSLPEDPTTPGKLVVRRLGSNDFQLYESSHPDLADAFWGRVAHKKLVITLSNSRLRRFCMGAGIDHPGSVIDIRAEIQRVVNGDPKHWLLAAHPRASDASSSALTHDPFRDGSTVARELDRLFALYNDVRQYIPLGDALARASYTSAVGAIEERGVPIDTPLLALLRSAWPALRGELYRSLRRDFSYLRPGWEIDEPELLRWLDDFYPGSFSSNGPCMLSDPEEIRRLARRLPPLQDLQQTSELVLHWGGAVHSIGHDGRERVPLRPFATSTGRNAPLTGGSLLYGRPPLRHLVRPAEGQYILEADYVQQEVGIASALSGDQQLREDYESGDPYLALAIAAGAAPTDATRDTHPVEREVFKACFLGVSYSMGPETLAREARLTFGQASQLIEAHKRRYPTFWAWRHEYVRAARSRGECAVAGGWRRSIGPEDSDASIANFPLQATGARVLQDAVVLLDAPYEPVIGVHHDAIYTETEEHDIDEAEDFLRTSMVDACKRVLGDFELSVDLNIFGHDEGLQCPKGADAWSRITNAIYAVGPVSQPVTTPNEHPDADDDPDPDDDPDADNDPDPDDDPDADDDPDPDDDADDVTAPGTPSSDEAAVESPP